MRTDIRSAGTLAHTPVHRILLWIAENAYTGSLVLARDSVKKSIIFEEGRPISARSNLQDESLGAILLAEGRITELQLQRALAAAESKEGFRLGEALVALGLIDHAKLIEALHRQFVRRFHGIFAWTDGKYALVPDRPADVARVDVPETLGELIFRGLLERHRSSAEAAALPPETKPVVTGGSVLKIEDLKLVGREMGFFRAINGLTDLKTLTQKSSLDDGVARAMLLALRDVEAIRLDAAEPAPGLAHRGPPIPRLSGKPGSEFIAEIVKRLESSGHQNFFEILGLSQKASDVEIKKAYFELAKLYHPDRLPGDISAEERKVAEAYFARVTEAQATIGNAALRKEYEAKLETEKSGIDAERVNAIVQSEFEFQKGRVLIKKGDFPGAVKLLQTAVGLYDGEPEYRVFLGWAMYREGKQKQNPVGAKKGKETLEKALGERERIADGHYFLGLMEKMDGNSARAKACFQKTLDLAPNHPEAASELRVMNMRESKKAEAPSGLKGLFGKKK